MSIQSEVRKAGPLTCNGVTTIFNFAFKVFAASDLYVKLSDGTTETVLVKDTDYTVALNADQDNNPGGSITTIGVASPYSAAYTLTITSQITNTQGTQLPNGGGWFPKVIENALDRVTILAQQVLAVAMRGVRQPISDAAAMLELPAKANRASKYLFFDGNGDPTAVTGVSGTTPVTAFMATVLDDANADTAVQTLVAGLSAEAAPAVNDVFIIGDTSEGKGNKMRFDDAFKIVNALTLKAVPQSVDQVAIYDNGAAAAKKATLDTLFNVINDLTVENFPVSSDVAPFYDISATAPRKATLQALAGAGIRGYLNGGVVSNNAGDAVNDLDITACRACDSTNLTFLNAAAMTKQLDVAWAVGSAAGMRDTGAIANGTWHIFIIKKDSDGVGDYLASLSPTAPTMPGGYTFFRRITSWLREGGSLVPISQNGDEFMRKTGVADVAAANPGVAAVTRTVSVPTGVTLEAIILENVSNVAAGGNVYATCTDLATNDVAPTSTSSDTGNAITGAGGSTVQACRNRVRCNTSAQFRSRLSFSDANVTLNITTLGWIDKRGRDS